MKVRYLGDTTGYGRSGFWADCPIWNVDEDAQNIGYGFYDNFLRYGLTPTITTIANMDYNGWIGFGGAGATITAASAVGGGIVLSLTDDNQAVSIKSENHAWNFTQDGGDLWFEARIKFSTVTTAEQAWFVGFTDTTAQTAAIPLTAAGAIADINCVGLHKPEGNTTAFDASYKADGVTAVEVNSDIGTLVADTYVKLGMRYKKADAKLYYYVDGVEQTTAKTIPDATGTDFPADVTLSPTVALLAATDDTETATLQWISAYQLSV